MKNEIEKQEKDVTNALLVYSIIAFVVILCFMIFGCGDKKERIIDGNLTIGKEYSHVKEVCGIYISDPFKSHLKYLHLNIESKTAKIDSVFEIYIENAASRDTLGNWNIIDSKKALEALWQFYLIQRNKCKQ